MEKYRKWTDQTAGVNPFVAANTKTAPLGIRILSAATALLKGIFFAVYIPIFVILYSIPLAFVQQAAAKVLLLLFGTYQIEDQTMRKTCSSANNTIILSNHLCFIDVVYYLYRIPGCHFIGFSQSEQKQPFYYLISPISIFFKLLSTLQPVFTLSTTNSKSSLKELFDSESYLKKGGPVVLFYQKIRTIGRGTIKIDKLLSQQIFSLEKDCIIVQLRYTIVKDSLFSLTTTNWSIIFTGLGTLLPGNNLRVRSIKQNSKDTHSANEVRQAVSSMSVGPLLQTRPSSYFQFYDFYTKTQKEGYKLQNS